MERFVGVPGEHDIVVDDFEDDFGSENNEFFSDDESVENEAAHDLLDFADHVTRNIRHIFSGGGNNGLGSNPGVATCDIYEDTWQPARSGREVYFAEILKIANGKTDDNDIAAASEVKRELAYTGQVDSEKGLGPLGELFDFQTAKRFTYRPMNERRFPSSFWQEPNRQTTTAVTRCARTIGGSAGVGGFYPDYGSPDLNDILEMWAISQY
ncbi:protein PERCC1-like [Tubulanus polymorphus]|uniref:protein PERCC1-like n=1 Tax=Tubulanus polymorphus TaxID=672921 RepID=UPI003DA49320